MKKPTDQRRHKIVHDFAKWTALSALRSGSPLKRAELVYDMIENHADWPVLFDTARAIDAAEFDRWHKKTVLDFVSAEPALKSDSQMGWAAKIVNVYLKTRVYLAGEGREGLVSVQGPRIKNSPNSNLDREFFFAVHLSQEILRRKMAVIEFQQQIFGSRMAIRSAPCGVTVSSS